MKRFLCPSALIAASVMCSALHAGTIVIKETDTNDVSGFDRWRSNDTAGSPSSSSASNSIGNLGDPVGSSSHQLRVGALFRLDAIPSWATITNVSLKVWAKQNETHANSSGAGDMTLELRALSSSLVENDSNWVQSQGGSLWTNPGGDIAPEILSTLTANSTTWVDNNLYAGNNDPALLSDYTFASTPEFVSAVTAASANALDPTFYFVMKLSDSDENAVGPRQQFFVVGDHEVASASGSSNRRTVPAQFPELIVEFVPEPTTLALLISLSGAAGFVRRR